MDKLVVDLLFNIGCDIIFINIVVVVVVFNFLGVIMFVIVFVVGFIIFGRIFWFF